MPKLSDIEEKYVNGYKVDKETDEVIYSDEKHVYFDRNDYVPYISVTTLIHHYVHEFDSAFWSAYKALEALVTPEDFELVKDQLLSAKKWRPDYLDQLGVDKQAWEDKRAEILLSYKVENEKGCERGTKIHAEYENKYYTKEQHSLQKFGLGGKFTCKKGYYQLDLEKGIYPEFLISLKSKDGFLRVAGQLDLLVKDGNDIYIYDIKTNKEIKQKSFFDKKSRSYQMMKFPLNNLMDCNYYHYSLQLSLYAYLLQQINPDFNIKKLQLIHVDHSNTTTDYECPYLKEDVERMLKHYKKQYKIKLELDRDKPISFD